MPVGIGSRWNADIGMQYAGRIGYMLMMPRWWYLFPQFHT